MHSHARALLLIVPLCVACTRDDAGPEDPSSTSMGEPVASGGSTASELARDTGDGTADSPSLACGRQSSAALAHCADAEALTVDTTFIAAERMPGSEHWAAVQHRCIDRLTELGYEVQVHQYASGVNVVGRRRGDVLPEEVVLAGAHYDHIAGCEGADDNASGVAGVLEVARVLSDVPTERTIAIACWDQEEIGLVGAKAWVADGRQDGEDVVAYFNYDMIGFASSEPDTQQIPPGFDLVFVEQTTKVADNEYRGDFAFVVADDLAVELSEAFLEHAAALQLPTIDVVLDAVEKNSPLFSDLRRSDHAAFWVVDLPAVFFTDTGEFRHDTYHCHSGPDSVDTLDFEFASKIVGATIGAMADTAVMVR